MLPPQRISDLEASSRDASSEVADLRRQLADYESLTKQLQEFTEDLQKKEKANQAKEKALKKDISELRLQVEDLQEQLEEQQEHLQEEVSKINAQKQSEITLLQQQSAMHSEDFRKEIRSLRERMKKHANERDMEIAKVEKRYTEELEDCREQIDSLQQEVEELSRVKEMDSLTMGVLSSSPSVSTTGPPPAPAVLTTDRETQTDTGGLLEDFPGMGAKERLASHLTGGTTSSSSSTQHAHGSGTPRVLTGLKTVNEELLYLAQQQVDRDGALREALEECEYLRHALLDSEHRHQLHMEQERMLKAEIRKLERLVTKESVDSEYLRNVMFKFFTSEDEELQEQLLPVIGELLAFNATENEKVREFFHASHAPLWEKLISPHPLPPIPPTMVHGASETPSAGAPARQLSSRQSGYQMHRDSGFLTSFSPGPSHVENPVVGSYGGGRSATRPEDSPSAPLPVIVTSQALEMRKSSPPSSQSDSSTLGTTEGGSQGSNAWSNPIVAEETPNTAEVEARTGLVTPPPPSPSRDSDVLEEQA